MLGFLLRSLPILGALLPADRGPVCNSDSGVVAIPDPAVDLPLAATKGREMAVVAGGCFWGIQAVYAHVKGVIESISGYSGGAESTAEYEAVCTGRTGHAEAVQITYDPSAISYGLLLKVFFSIAHDPTQLNQQGPDTGTQYRSAIFCATEDQKRVALAYIEQLNRAGVFSGPIVTQVVPLEAFYPAEDYHQDYVVHHPENMYIVINDLPKVDHLRQQFPELYVKRK